MTSFMVFLETTFQAAWVERMGWTLVHSLWQIAAITGLYAIIAVALRNRSASCRYLVGCAAMLAMLVCPALTYLLLPITAVPTGTVVIDRKPAIVVESSPMTRAPVGNSPHVGLASVTVDSPARPIGVVTVDRDSSEEAAITFGAGILSALRRCVPWFTLSWLAGVLLFSLRPIAGWLHVRRLRRGGVSVLDDGFGQVCGQLMEQLGVNRAVRFAQSALVEVPTVVGHLRPLIIYPASAITGLSTMEIELILAHELAHVRRRDYLVNLVQTGIEAVLFHHPGMWWVSAAHQQGLVHRDNKPSNILLEEDVDRALISDCGLARAADDASLTRTGFHPGTPQYMSPEQASGQSVDARSDLFSLGSTLYTMCTGRPPFRAESSCGVMRRISDEAATPIRELNPDIPEWLVLIIETLMAKEKDRTLRFLR